MLAELARAGIGLTHRHGRLFVTGRAPIDAAWAINTWFDVETIAIRSISDAATALRSRQRNWALYAPVHRGRATLIEQRLPPVSAKALEIGAPAPTAPLGSWTLLDPELVLAARHCSSPFKNGEPSLLEDRDGPPSRAYLKLWEAFLYCGRWPQHGDRCLDLGASPGGWTWLLVRCGGRVVAVDKAPLDGPLRAQAEWIDRSAYALEPAELVDAYGPIDWLCSDIVGYPGRIAGLLHRWIDAARNIICTIKFQGPTDHATIDELRALPGARLVHLFHNKHELTFIRISDPVAPSDRDTRAEPSGEAANS